MKLNWVEKGPGYLSGIRDLPSTFSASAIGAALISAIFGISVDVIWISAAQQGGWPMEAIVGWLFACHVLGGLLILALTLYYKMPIVGASSIAGGIMFVLAAVNFSIPELYGAAMFSGLIVFLLGITGTIKKVMGYLPMPIVLGMTAGVLLKFVTKIPGSVQQAPIIAGSAFVAFMLCSRFVKKVPATLAGLLVGVVACALTIDLDFTAVDFTLSKPMFMMPAFNLKACLSVGIPLALLVIGAENAQAMGVLQANGYKPPVNGMTIYSGAFGMIGPLFGIHNVNVAGPMTVMCAGPDAGPKDKRYGAAVWNAILYGIAGPFVIPLVGFFAVIPKPLVAVIAGLAMIKVVSSSLKDTFANGKFLMGGFFAFIIGVSGISPFSIGAAFWALMGGIIITLLLDGNDYKEFVQQSAEMNKIDESVA